MVEALRLENPLSREKLGYIMLLSLALILVAYIATAPRF